MADKILREFQGAVIQIDGVCYEHIGKTTDPVNTDPSEVQGVYPDCTTCLQESSSSSFGESSSSSKDSSSSSSAPNSSSSSSSSSGDFSESSSSSEGYSESSSSSDGESSSSSSEPFERVNCDGNTNPQIKVTVCWSGPSSTEYAFLGSTWKNGESKIYCPMSYDDAGANEYWRFYSLSNTLDLRGSTGAKQEIKVKNTYGSWNPWLNHTILNKAGTISSGTVVGGIDASDMFKLTYISINQFTNVTITAGVDYGNVTIKWQAVEGGWKASLMSYATTENWGTC